MRIDWKVLLERCPEFSELAADARSIAANERWPWYEAWLPGSTIFGEACRKAAAQLGVPPQVVKPVAMQGLTDAYATAKARLQRNLQLARSAAAETAGKRQKIRVLERLLTKRQNLR